MTLLIHQIIAKRQEILAIAEKCGVANVRVFGSVSRGQEHEKSDIDWDELKRFRNYIIHNYDNLDWGRIWTKAQK